MLFQSITLIAIDGMAYTPQDIPNVVYMITARNDTFGAYTHLIVLD